MPCFFFYAALRRSMVGGGRLFSLAALLLLSWRMEALALIGSGGSDRLARRTSLSASASELSSRVSLERERGEAEGVTEGGREGEREGASERERGVWRERGGRGEMGQQVRSPLARSDAELSPRLTLSEEMGGGKEREERAMGRAAGSSRRGGDSQRVAASHDSLDLPIEEDAASISEKLPGLSTDGQSAPQGQSPPQQRSERGQVLHTLASNALALLSSSEEEEEGLVSHAAESDELVAQIFDEYDADHNGLLSAQEARRCFEALARELLVTAAAGGAAYAGREGREPRRRAAAAAHAKRLLQEEAELDGGGDGGSPPSCERSPVCEMADQLLALADSSGDGQISLEELASLFSDRLLPGPPPPSECRPPSVAALPPLHSAPHEALNELRGSLRLLPRIARHFESLPTQEADSWHERVPGDSHTFMRWRSPDYARDQLSIVGLGRSADASCYYLPEWGIVLDAGLAAKSFAPKTVLLTHGHR